MRNSSNQKGFAHILAILLLLTGVGVTVYLVNSKTPLKIFPKAYDSTAKPVSGPISNKSEYKLVPSTNSTIHLTDSTTNPGNAYMAQTTLKDRTGTVASQSAMVYTWTASNSKVVNVLPSAYCAPGVSEPCPMAQAQLTGGVAGSAQVNVVVTLDRMTLASTSFKVVVAK